MSLFFGFDPDLHHVGKACVDENGTCRGVWCIRGFSEKAKGRDAVMGMLGLNEVRFQGIDLLRQASGFAVESQELYRGTDANVRSILHLAMVAGGLVQFVMSHRPTPSSLYFPVPSEWKGNIPKHVHQARICSKQNWEYEIVGTGDRQFARPKACPAPGAAFIKPAEWKHVIDAVGLAVYARDRFIKEQETKARRATQ